LLYSVVVIVYKVQYQANYQVGIKTAANAVGLQNTMKLSDFGHLLKGVVIMEKRNKVALIIDVQNDFVTGALANPLVQACLPYLAAKAIQQRDEGWLFIGTKDTHADNEAEYLQTQEGRNLPVWHCGIGTWGHDIVSELADIYESGSIAYINKPTFGSIELAEILQDLHENDGIEIIEIVGFVSEICVVSNAILLKAYLPEVPIRVDSKGCAGITEQSHNEAMNVLRACQVEVI